MNLFIGFDEKMSEMVSLGWPFNQSTKLIELTGSWLYVFIPAFPPFHSLFSSINFTLTKKRQAIPLFHFSLIKTNSTLIHSLFNES